MGIFKDMWVPPVKNTCFDVEKRPLCFLETFFVSLVTSVIFLAVVLLRLQRFTSVLGVCLGSFRIGHRTISQLSFGFRVEQNPCFWTDDVFLTSCKLPCIFPFMIGFAVAIYFVNSVSILLSRFCFIFFLTVSALSFFPGLSGVK